MYIVQFGIFISSIKYVSSINVIMIDLMIVFSNMELPLVCSAKNQYFCTIMLGLICRMKTLSISIHSSGKILIICCTLRTRLTSFPKLKRFLEDLLFKNNTELKVDVNYVVEEFRQSGMCI